MNRPRFYAIFKGNEHVFAELAPWKTLADLCALRDELSKDKRYQEMRFQFDGQFLDAWTLQPSSYDTWKQI